MPESLFDDYSSVPVQSGHQDTEAHPPTPEVQQPKRSQKRFHEEDMLGDLPKDDEPLYPELLKPPPEPTAPKRPLPWFIDIFLYPFNRAGSLTLALLLIVPTLLVFITYGSFIAAYSSPLLIFPGVPLGIASFLALVLMILYYVWYVIECIRDSSEGAVRAPNTHGLSPDLSYLFGYFVQVTVCVLIFVGLYLSTIKSFPLSFMGKQVLGIVLALIFPMTLLGVVTTESLRGLNPVANLKLICKTSLTYLPLSAGLFAAHRLLFWACQHFLPHDDWLSLGRLVFVYVEIYGLLISAHVLGRFAWRKRDTLFWE